MISPIPNSLKSAIRVHEIDQCLKKLRNTSMVIDLIHNKMLQKFSPTNKSLCHLFNCLFRYSHVPSQWKQAIVVPLLKNGKPPSEPGSYRPVSLTSCLGKLFERVIGARINWFVETNGIPHSSQAGFRPKRSTVDHIIQLEIDVKQGFALTQSTVAIFLDIA